MKQAPKKRLKTKSITMYISPKYTDKVNYLKHTTGLTHFVEDALENLVVDDQIMTMVKALESKKNG